MNKIKTPTNKMIDIIFKEIKDFEGSGIMLGTKFFSQYETVNNIISHQNDGFLLPLADGQEDTREFVNIGTQIIETRVVNSDLDSKDIDVYTDNFNYIDKEFLARSLLKNYFKQTNHGEKMNDIIETVFDEGNIVVRKVNNEYNSGEIYEPVQLSNLYVIDQSAKTLEDTTVIEKQILNQTNLSKMNEWTNVDKVIKYGNLNKDEDLPSYEAYYRYGEMSKADFNFIKADLNGEVYEPIEEDRLELIPSLYIVVKAKKKKWEGVEFEHQGIPVFIEELKPEVIKISSQLKITKYKPYEECHLNKYDKRWLRKGDREVLIPYQNRANEIINRFSEILEIASKYVFWSKDQKIALKNVLSAIKNGQVIHTEHLELLNNVFPNLTLFRSEWNANINDAQRALKAFEVASGESLPGSTSATAVSVQNAQVGKYYDFKREKIGLFFSCVTKRWTIPVLIKKTTTLEKMEIVGDPSYLEEYANAMAKGWLVQNLEFIASKGGISKEQAEQLIETKKQELLKNKRNFLELEKDFLKDVELYVGVNTTGELFNKQAKISNGLSLLQYIANPTIMADPQAKDIVVEVASSLGFNINPNVAAQPQQPQPVGQPQTPMKEQTLNESGNSNML